MAKKTPPPPAFEIVIPVTQKMLATVARNHLANALGYSGCMSPADAKRMGIDFDQLLTRVTEDPMVVANLKRQLNTVLVDQLEDMIRSDEVDVCTTGTYVQDACDAFEAAEAKKSIEDEAKDRERTKKQRIKDAMKLLNDQGYKVVKAA